MTWNLTCMVIYVTVQQLHTHDYSTSRRYGAIQGPKISKYDFVLTRFHRFKCAYHNLSISQKQNILATQENNKKRSTLYIVKIENDDASTYLVKCMLHEIIHKNEIQKLRSSVLLNQKAYIILTLTKIKYKIIKLKNKKLYLIYKF